MTILFRCPGGDSKLTVSVPRLDIFLDTSKNISVGLRVSRPKHYYFVITISVPRGRLELPHLTAHPPQGCLATSYNTWAYSTCEVYGNFGFFSTSKNTPSGVIFVFIILLKSLLLPLLLLLLHLEYYLVKHEYFSFVDGSLWLPYHVCDKVLLVLPLIS